jgi:hypothetical protein
MIAVFEQNGSRMRRFRKPEGSDVDEALLKLLKQKESDNVTMSGLLPMLIFGLFYI